MPRGASRAAMAQFYSMTALRALCGRVGLRVGARGLEGREGGAPRLDACEGRVGREVDAVAAGGVELGHEGEVGERDGVADEEGARCLGGGALERREAALEEVPRPGGVVAAARFDVLEGVEVVVRL